MLDCCCAVRNDSGVGTANGGNSVLGGAADIVCRCLYCLRSV